MPELRYLTYSCLRQSPARRIHSLGFDQRFYHVFKRFYFFLNTHEASFTNNGRSTKYNNIKI